MRVIGGEWRGRTLIAPPGQGTRPTADRVRQALFDMLLHAPWGGRELLEGARVLDAFAGSGALGLEALSRGAAHATFVERDGAALAALRANIARCGAEGRTAVVAGSPLTQPSPAGRGLLPPLPQGEGQGEGMGFRLVFLDPPYGQDLIPLALAGLRAGGCLASGALLVAETGRSDAFTPPAEVLAVRAHGAARLTIWRE